MDAPIHVDVALIRPRDIGSVPPGAPVQDPLGVGYLAAALRGAGLRTVVLDAHALGLSNMQLVECVAELRPRVVGLSLHAFADYPHCVEISRYLRQMQAAPYCVWGGEHATFHAHRILEQHPEVDAVVVGEGELTFVELVFAVLAEGQEHGDFLGNAISRLDASRAICGAVRRGRGRLLDGGFRHAIDALDTIADPHKDIVEEAIRNGMPVSVSILTGRGCTHSCKFCTAHDFMRLGGGVAWRRRSPRCVVQEMARLVEAYLSKPNVHPVLNFQDVIFLGTSRASKRWVIDFMEEMRRRNLSVPFYCMARADAIIANADILPQLVEAGLWSVEVGIESGVDRILQRYNKRNAAAQNEEAVRLLRESGVTFDASGFIMFDPFMTLEELRENACYLSRFGAATWDFFVTRLQLYPGTAYRQEMIDRGMFKKVDDIGCTDDYEFEDPRVAEVARVVRYYDMGIRRLDLALRDAKAQIAQAIRSRHQPNVAIQAAVELVHDTYRDHLLELIDATDRGELQKVATPGIKRFLGRVSALADLLDELLQGVKWPRAA